MSSPAITSATAGPVLVTGPTGNVGVPLVASLLARGQRVRAALQPGVDAPWTPQPHLEVVAVDLADRTGLMEAAEGADAVFVLVPPGPEQEAWQENVIRAAHRARRIVKLSAFDTGPRSPWAMGRWHHTGERQLAAIGVSHVILRPQYFMQNLFRDSIRLSAGSLRTFIPPERAVGMIDAGDVGEVAAALLLSDRHEGEVLKLTGPAAIRPVDVARAVSRALGHPVGIDYLEPAAALAELHEAGVPDWLARDTVSICQQSSALVNGTVAEVLGRPARSVVRAAAERFAAAAPGRR